MKTIGKKLVFLGFLAAAGCSSSPEYVVSQSGQEQQERQQAREESREKVSKQEKLKQQAQQQEADFEGAQDLLDDYYAVPEESNSKADYDFYSVD